MSDRAPLTTDMAHAHVAAKRKRGPEQATWFDVAEAFDEGLRSALANRRAAQLQFAKLNVKNDRWDTTGTRQIRRTVP